MHARVMRAVEGATPALSGYAVGEVADGCDGIGLAGIKEQQLGLFADRTICHEFMANQFWVPLSAFSYILIDHLRRTVLVGSEFAASKERKIA